MTLSRRTRTLITAALSVAIGAAIAIVVNVLTDGWNWVWWVVLGALVVVNVAVYGVSGGEAGRVSASGAGAVAGGGSLTGKVTTKVRGTHAAGPDGGDGVSATGAGAVVAGGDIADVETDVQGDK